MPRNDINAILKDLFAGDKNTTPVTQCLSDETLAELLETGASGKGADAALRHLAWCDECLDLFMASYNVLELEAPSRTAEIAAWIKSMHEKIRRFALVIKMFPGHISPLVLDPGFIRVPALSLGAIRGQTSTNKTNLVVVKKDIPPFSFEVEVEKISVGLCQVLIYAEEIQSGKPARDLRVSLCLEGRELDSFITEEGKVVFDEVRKGRYLITVAEQGHRMCDFDLSLV
jgi:hypothetical protein